MADNITLNAGTGGDTFAADDIGPGVKYSRVKLTLGADGVNDGDVSSSNPMPVATHAVTQSGTWTVQPGNTANTTAWKVDASSVAVPVTDNAGSLTVDGTVSVSGTVTVDSELTTADLDTGAGTDTRAVVGLVVAASGGAVNLSGNSGTKDNGTVRVVLATDQPQLTNALKVDGSAVTQPVSGTVTVTQATASNLKVDLSGTAANATAIKVDGSAVTQPVSGTVTTNEAAATSGGATFSWNSIKATATSVKGSAGQVYGWYIYNSNSSAVYVQFFNTASGSVTLGTTTPVYSLGIPATSGANAFIPCGIAHGTAITIAATTTATGSTAPTNNVDINVFYK